MTKMHGPSRCLIFVHYQTLKETAWLRNLAPFAWPRIMLVVLAVLVLLVSISIAVGCQRSGEKLQRCLARNGAETLMDVG